MLQNIIEENKNNNEQITDRQMFLDGQILHLCLEELIDKEELVSLQYIYFQVYILSILAFSILSIVPITESSQMSRSQKVDFVSFYFLSFLIFFSIFKALRLGLEVIGHISHI